jgi:hypothetical protein
VQHLVWYQRVLRPFFDSDFSPRPSRSQPIDANVLCSCLADPRGGLSIRPGEVLGDRILLGAIGMIGEGSPILPEGFGITLMLLVAPESVFDELFDAGRSAWSWAGYECVDTLKRSLVEAGGESSGGGGHI